MNIVVQVDDVTIDSVIGEHWDSDDERRVPRTLGDAIVDEATRQLVARPEWGTLRDRIQSVRNEEIRRLVGAEVANALSSPIQRTNSFGEAVGGTFTLREEIARLAAEGLTKPKDRGNYGSKETPLQELIRTEIDGALKKELAATIAEEKAKVVAAVRARAADLIAQAVKEGIGR